MKSGARIFKGTATAILKSLLFLYVLATFTLSWAYTARIVAQKTARNSPTYPKQDISRLLTKTSLTDKDYDVLWRQCGLSQIGVARLRERRELLQYQTQFFAPTDIRCTPFGGIGFTQWHNGAPRCVCPLKNGDVLVSPSAHILSWRIGHAGIVTNAASTQTVEALSLGSLSTTSDAKKWAQYGAFAVLTCKNQTAAENAAAFAGRNLTGLQYHLFPKKYSPHETPLKTQCSHLVWQAFYAVGLDIAPNGGAIITPKDLLQSPLLEPVQVCGMDVNTLRRYL